VNVVDASAVVSLIAPDVTDEAPADVLFQEWAERGTPLAAPGLLWLEAQNALLSGIRRGRWNGAEADAAAAKLAMIPVRRMDSPADVVRAFELARRFDNWPVYDMLYVALAERLGAELYTSDARLGKRLAHLGWIRGVDVAEPVTKNKLRESDDADGVGSVRVSGVVDELDLAAVRHDVVSAVGAVLADDRGGAVGVLVALFAVGIRGLFLRVDGGLVAPDEPVRGERELQLIRPANRHRGPYRVAGGRIGTLTMIVVDAHPLLPGHPPRSWGRVI
jgi:predicted nucleic acid-binding protein